MTPGIRVRLSCAFEYIYTCWSVWRYLRHRYVVMSLWVRDARHTCTFVISIWIHICIHVHIYTHIHTQNTHSSTYRPDASRHVKPHQRIWNLVSGPKHYTPNNIFYYIFTPNTIYLLHIHIYTRNTHIQAWRETTCGTSSMNLKPWKWSQTLYTLHYLRITFHIFSHITHRQAKPWQWSQTPYMYYVFQ